VESSILPLPLRPKLDAQQPSITQTQPAPTPTLLVPEDTYSSATRAEAALPSPPSVPVDEPPSTTRDEPASTPTLPVPVDEAPSATRDETAFSPSTAAPTCTLPFATRDEPASTPIPPAPPPAPDGEPPSATCDDQVPIPSPPTLEVSQPYIAQEEEAPTPPSLHTHVTRATQGGNTLLPHSCTTSLAGAPSNTSGGHSQSPDASTEPTPRCHECSPAPFDPNLAPIRQLHALHTRTALDHLHADTQQSVKPQSQPPSPPPSPPHDNQPESEATHTIPQFDGVETAARNLPHTT